MLSFMLLTDLCNAECCHYIHNIHTQGSMMHGYVSLSGRFSDRGSGISKVSEHLVEHGYVCNNDLYVTFLLCFFLAFL